MIEDKIKKQEDLKRKTLDYEYTKKEKLMEKEYLLQASKEIKIKRETQDIDAEHLIIKQREKRETFKDIFSLGFQFMGQGFQYLNTHKSSSLTVALYLGLGSMAVYGSKYSISFMYQFLTNRYMQPALVRETSRFGWKNMLKNPFKSQSLFDNIILNESLGK